MGVPGQNSQSQSKHIWTDGGEVMLQTVDFGEEANRPKGPTEAEGFSSWIELKYGPCGESW